MGTGVTFGLIAFFVIVTGVFVGLMFILPEWFGISKKEPSDEKQTESKDS